MDVGYENDSDSDSDKDHDGNSGNDSDSGSDGEPSTDGGSEAEDSGQAKAQQKQNVSVRSRAKREFKVPPTPTSGWNPKSAKHMTFDNTIGVMVGKVNDPIVKEAGLSRGRATKMRRSINNCRMAADAVFPISVAAYQRLEKLVEDSVIYTKSARRVLISESAVRLSLKNMGIQTYS